MVESVVGALEEALVAPKEAEAMEVLLGAVTKARVPTHPRPRPPAAASRPELLQDMSEVSGTFHPLPLADPLVLTGNS